MKPYYKLALIPVIFVSFTSTANFFESPIRTTGCLLVKTDTIIGSKTTGRITNNCASCKDGTVQVYKNSEPLIGVGSTFEGLNPGVDKFFYYNSSAPGVYTYGITALRNCKTAPPPPPPPSPTPAGPTYCPGPVENTYPEYPPRAGKRMDEKKVDAFKGALLCVKKSDAPTLGRLKCVAKVGNPRENEDNKERLQCASEESCGDLYWSRAFEVNFKDTESSPEIPNWCIHVSDLVGRKTYSARFYVLDK